MEKTIALTLIIPAIAFVAVYTLVALREAGPGFQTAPLRHQRGAARCRGSGLSKPAELEAGIAFARTPRLVWPFIARSAI